MRRVAQHRQGSLSHLRKLLGRRGLQPAAAFPGLSNGCRAYRQRLRRRSHWREPVLQWQIPVCCVCWRWVTNLAILEDDIRHLYQVFCAVVPEIALALGCHTPRSVGRALSDFDDAPVICADIGIVQQRLVVGVEARSRHAKQTPVCLTSLGETTILALEANLPTLRRADKLPDACAIPLGQRAARNDPCESGIHCFGSVAQSSSLSIRWHIDFPFEKKTLLGV